MFILSDSASDNLFQAIIVLENLARSQLLQKIEYFGLPNERELEKDVAALIRSRQSCPQVPIRRLSLRTELLPKC
jgi:hypothetical protein